MDILPPSFTDIGHPLVCGWGMMQLSLTHFCALVFPLLTVGGIPQCVRVRMLPPWNIHISVPTKVPTLSIMGILPYMVRGWWLFEPQRIAIAVILPSFTDIGHPLICEWGTLLRFRTRLCVSRLPILTIWVIPQYVRVRMLLTWKNTLQCHEKLPTLSMMGILPYVC
jgi:hypothetical protein